MITCSKPGCGRAGAVVLAYDYAARRATLLDPGEGRPPPHLYSLCGPCAERLGMPRGWTLDDRRDRPPLFAPELPDAAAATG